MIRRFICIVLLGLFLGGCSGDGGSSASTGVTLTQPDPTSPVSGGGVKGPLVNANAILYLVDLTATDLKGAQISSGSTNESAALQGITIPAGALDTFLLEITADSNTTDLNSGVAPILTVYRTVVNAEAIRTGRVFATPITTLALALAQQSGPYASLEDLNIALRLSAQQVISTLGFGLDASTDPFTSNPLLTAADTTDEQQARVLAYRLAIEGLAAILDLLATEILAVDPTSAITVDDVLAAISEDLSDGAIDGMSAGGAVATLVAVTDINAVVGTDPALLMIPGTTTPITRVADIIVSETGTTGVTVATANITSGSVAVVARPAKSLPDIDGDGVPDNADAFPSDANETLDTDSDGIGNNADDDDDGDGVADGDDAFPLQRDESLDTDGDGIGNNSDDDDDGDGTLDSADALPLVATETVDTDGDGIGNNADTDDDGDGVDDVSDSFPLDAAEQLDTDGDGLGNNSDTDDDGDGVADADDNLPLDAQGSVASSATIGPDGGTLTSPDGLMTLSFPANAVSVNTIITIGSPTDAVRAAADSEERPLDGLYLLGPQGQQFAEPVTMTWTLPTSSTRPNTVKHVVSRSNGIEEGVLGRVITNPFLGTVKTTINHFSEILIFSGTYKIVINNPGARKGGLLLWEYSLVDGGDAEELKKRDRIIFSEKISDTELLPVEVISGSEFISGEQHVDSIIINGAFDERNGSISAVCDDASVDGLTARIGFDVYWTENISGIGGLLPQDGLIRVEANGTCRETIEITEPQFISIGNDVERITEAPERIVIDECSFQQQRFHVVVSNTQTRIVNNTGSCSRVLNFNGSDRSIFGAQALVADTTSRLFVYGESGVFITEPIDGVFGELSDFTSTTTDIQFAVNDDGSEISNQAYATNNAGGVKLRTLNADGSNTNVSAFNVIGLIGKTLIGFFPATSKTGFGITSETPSKMYHFNFGGETVTATELGSVGDTALGISCARLACETETSCSISNTETLGCAVSAFDSEEIHPVFFSDVVTNAASTPTFNFSAPIPGIKTAAPYTKSNANGQLVIATVNDNEIGKVLLTIRDASGTEVQTAEFFLTAFEGTTGFAGTGSSIVMMEPSAEYPNGAVRIGVKNPVGTNDGILTIPVTEALLGSSPVPFFGPTFTN